MKESLKKLETIKEQLIRHEGRRTRPYVDTVGKITIGIGHNLTDNGLPDFIIDLLYEHDMKGVIQNLDTNLSWWREQPENIRNALMDLCFNMGIGGLLGFHRFLQALKDKNYLNAAMELQDSRWFQQVGFRGPELVNQVRNG